MKNEAQQSPTISRSNTRGPMRRMHLATAFGVATCLGGGLVGTAIPAFADQGKPVVTAAPAQPGAAVAGDKAAGFAAAASTGAPAGYVRVQSAVLSAPSGQQTEGTVSCPGNKVPVGGGVTISANDLNDNINTSYPAGKSWIAYVNSGGASTTFTVSAICVNKPKGYQVVESSAVSNPPGQNGEAVSCPGSTVPWGGGVDSTSGSVGVNVNSTYPSGPQTWTAYMNNSTGTTAGFFVLAVCANRPHLYSQPAEIGTNGEDSEDLGTGTCGHGQVVVGGGAYSSSSSVYVNLNSTYSTGKTQWRSWVNNNTFDTPSFTAYATCVGV
jgi:hypothetical protein